MVKLGKIGYSQIYRLYLTSESFFPLIAAVLLDEQNGVVYVDDPISPSQAYVEHTFGFAQVFGKTVESFEQELGYYLLEYKCFNPSKIRLYATYLPAFLASPKHESLRSHRQRFTIDTEGFFCNRDISSEIGKNINLCGVDANNISSIQSNFGVVTRFWRSPIDFIERSNAVVVLYKGEPASICYSAAEANNSVEVDVLTLPEYRNLGLARIAVVNFINQCVSLSLHPLWDCFTNNSGSMMLCKSVGFTATNAPYPFFTINK